VADSMRTFLKQATPMDTQTRTTLVRLPDIPGLVVQVRRLVFDIVSFSSVTALIVVFHHNINLAETLSTGDTTDAWAWMAAGLSGGGPRPLHLPFEPPFELVGTQRMDTQLSAGTGEGDLTVMYTTRREPNRTRWNAIRARTSFERG